MLEKGCEFGAFPNHPNSRYSVFLRSAHFLPLKRQNATRRIPARAHVFRRSSQPPKSLAPRKYRRILKTTSAKHRFQRSSGAVRLPPPKTFPELLARFSRTTAKNGHCTQAKRHFLHTRWPPLPEKRSPRTRKGCKLQKPSRSESASNIVFYDGS